MSPHSSTLAWKIPWMEKPGRLQSMGSLSQTWLRYFTFTFHFSLSSIGEGNGKPLQSSCLENSRDGGAWWAAIYGVAQSQTRLKQLSSSSSSHSVNDSWVLNCKNDITNLLSKCLQLDFNLGSSDVWAFQLINKDARW